MCVAAVILVWWEKISAKFAVVLPVFEVLLSHHTTRVASCVGNFSFGSISAAISRLVFVWGTQAHFLNSSWESNLIFLWKHCFFCNMVTVVPGKWLVTTCSNLPWMILYKACKFMLRLHVRLPVCCIAVSECSHVKS